MYAYVGVYRRLFGVRWECGSPKVSISGQLERLIVSRIASKLPYTL
jgi:hypothetical protein